MEEAYVREYLPFLPGWTLWVMYPLAFAAIGVMVFGLLRRYRRYQANSEAGAGAAVSRVPGLGRALADAFLQRKVLERRLPAVLHLAIFYGMVLLFIGTVLVLIDEDILKQVGAGKMLQGGFYVAFEFVLDLAGLALVVGLAVALVRRVALKPPFLTLRRETLVILLALLFVAVSGFLLEAYRIASQAHPSAGAAFVGSTLAALLPDLSGAGADLLAYRVLWWSHFAVAVGLIAAIGYTGLSHLLTIPANVALQDPARPRPRLTTPFNLAEILESDDEDVELVAGAPSSEALAPAVRLGVDACVNCGRCHQECPAVASGRDLSPRDLVQRLQSAVRQGDEVEAGELEAAVWACTNCYACEESCPARIRHVDLVLDFRRALVDQNRLDSQKLSVLQALDRNQNPYKLPSHERAAWLGELPAAEEILWQEGRQTEWLYWLGCSAAYDERTSQVARACIDLFRAADLSFSVLGPLEICCGEPAKRLGEEGRFQTIALTNMEMLRETGVERIVTHCPHCLNVLKHEYGSLGWDIPVVHHSQVLADLVAAGLLAPSSEAPRLSSVAYHEPCNLARAGEAEGAVERAGVGHLRLPTRSGARTFCCGGGGANMWYSVEPEEVRISQLRVVELRQTEAERVATSCPFCLSMLTDAMGSMSGERLPVVDIAELLAEQTLPAAEPTPIEQGA
jgi:Fe-S oxidoreductase/nitrate reductase gamma subunit